MKCSTCIFRYGCDDATMHDCIQNGFTHYERDSRVISRGDWIRHMNDEELAQLLNDFRCGNCLRRGNNCFPGDLEAWLKQPMKEEQ